MNDINNHIDYNNDDASIELINNQNKNRRERELEQQRINNLAYERAKAERAIANSVGNTVSRIMYDNERAKTIERQRKNRIKATVGAALVFCSLSLGLITANAEEIKIEHELHVDTNEKITQKAQLLISRKLASKAEGNKPFTILDNRIDDYKKLYVTSPKDVYIYLEVFGDNKNEFDKFIKAVYYYDINGEICYYTSFIEFLNRNGYADEKDFKEKIENDYKETIKIQLENGKEQEFTYSETSIRKGGK